MNNAHEILALMNGNEDESKAFAAGFIAATQIFGQRLPFEIGDFGDAVVQYFVKNTVAEAIIKEAYAEGESARSFQPIEKNHTGISPNTESITYSEVPVYRYG